MSGKSKGSQFERDVCRYLSYWFSEGKREDLFWRADSSGARATFRSRQGKSVVNAGDIQSVDEEGFPFTKFFTIECKKGYNYDSPIDMIDKPTPCIWNDFLDQVTESQQAAKTPGWMIISQRDRRHLMVFINWDALVLLEQNGAKLLKSVPQIRITLDSGLRFFGTTFEQFEILVPPSAIIDAL